MVGSHYTGVLGLQRFSISIFSVTKIAYSRKGIALGFEIVIPFIIELLICYGFASGSILVIVRLGTRIIGSFLGRGHHPFFYSIPEVLGSKTAL